jgi:hypothetical protein
MSIFIRTVPNVMRYYACTADDAQRFIDLREEGFSTQQAALMAGLTDPPEDPALGVDLPDGGQRMTDDEILALAVKHKLGRTLKPIGLDTGDVFYTDASYRTAEILDFARELLAAGVAPTHEPIAQIRGGDVYWLVDDGKPLPEGAYLYAAAGVETPLEGQQ